MSIIEKLRKHSATGELWEKATDGKVRCLACAHKCVIAEGGTGICGVRFNEAGTLKVPWGYISSCGLDPIEKKPFFHALPGSTTLSFGMPGCNFRCPFCQNYELSQAARDPLCGFANIGATSPAELTETAVKAGARIMISTYNEPLITAEWGAAVLKEARKQGIRGGFVSDAYASEEVLDYLKPCVDFYKADLKTFDDENYSKVIGGRLEKVLKGIEMVYRKGFWLEIVTLFIPGFNDDAGEMADIAGFIAGLSVDIPWHVTAFHPDYAMTDRGPTAAPVLLAAREIGLKKGLKYVYTGNIPNSGFENTACPKCGLVLLKRRGFTMIENQLKISDEGAGSCRNCGEKIPGVWK